MAGKFSLLGFTTFEFLYELLKEHMDIFERRPLGHANKHFGLKKDHLLTTLTPPPHIHSSKNILHNLTPQLQKLVISPCIPLDSKLPNTHFLQELNFNPIFLNFQNSGNTPGSLSVLSIRVRVIMSSSHKSGWGSGGALVSMRRVFSSVGIGLMSCAVSQMPGFIRLCLDPSLYDIGFIIYVTLLSKLPWNVSSFLIFFSVENSASTNKNSYLLIPDLSSIAFKYSLYFIVTNYHLGIFMHPQNNFFYTRGVYGKNHHYKVVVLIFRDG